MRSTWVKRTPRYKVGDWVTTAARPARRVWQIVEYRGPLSHDGMPIYRLRHTSEWGVNESEKREDWLEPYTGPIPAAAPAAG